jgi:hypothetical protein
MREFTRHSNKFGQERFARQLSRFGHGGDPQRALCILEMSLEKLQKRPQLVHRDGVEG